MNLKGLPDGVGCMSVLLHAGSRPAEPEDGIPCIGTDDPAVWRHTLWGPGGVWVAELKCDVLSRRPQLEELLSHFYGGAERQALWRRVEVPTAAQ